MIDSTKRGGTRGLVPPYAESGIHGEDVALAHEQIGFFVDLEFVTRVGAEDDEIAGLLGALTLDDADETGIEAALELEDTDDIVAEISEPTPEDLLAEDDDDVLEVDAAPAPEVPRGFVAEPNEE